MGRPRVLVASHDAALASLMRWVQARLDETGTTYQQVAVDVSYSRSWVSRTLCGRRLPPWQLIEAIAKRCGASPREARKLWEAAEAAQLRRQVRRIGTSPPSDIASWLDMYDALGNLITSKVGSHRELVRKDRSGQLTRSTIGAILRHERSLSHDVLVRVLTICELSDMEHPGFRAHLVLCVTASLGGSAVTRLPGLICNFAFSSVYRTPVHDGPVPVIRGRPPRQDVRAARALRGRPLGLTALPAPGAAEVSGVKGGRRPFPQETRSVLEAGGAAP